jgi:hypothetical protein
MSPRASWPPPLILLAACLAPGAGHLLLGLTRRGLGFAFFALFLGTITWQLAGPQISLIGHAAGGLFVWALSIPDAYRAARWRAAVGRVRELARARPAGVPQGDQVKAI